MSIYRSELLRGVERGDRKWKVSHGKGSKSHFSFWKSRLEMSIFGSEILRKEQQHKVSYRCSLPSSLQERSEDCQELHRIPMNSRFWRISQSWSLVLLQVTLQFPFLSFFISSLIFSAASFFICRFLAFTSRET